MPATNKTVPQASCGLTYDHPPHFDVPALLERLARMLPQTGLAEAGPTTGADIPQGGAPGFMLRSGPIDILVQIIVAPVREARGGGARAAWLGAHDSHVMVTAMSRLDVGGAIACCSLVAWLTALALAEEEAPMAAFWPETGVIAPATALAGLAGLVGPALPLILELPAGPGEPAGVTRHLGAVASLGGDLRIDPTAGAGLDLLRRLSRVAVVTPSGRFGRRVNRRLVSGTLDFQPGWPVARLSLRFGEEPAVEPVDACPPTEAPSPGRFSALAVRRRLFGPPSP